jgi:DNA-binding CsgD family transcriptional regulator
MLWMMVVADRPGDGVATVEFWAMTQSIRSTLLERAREQAELDAVIASVLEGRGATVVIAGPAGIGKTALVDQVRTRAEERGLAVLAGRGGELERDFGFGVVRQLLEPTVHRAPPDQRRRLMSGAARLAERVFMSAPTDEQTAEPPDAVLHGLYWLVANLAVDTPVLLAIDDAHWTDPASLRFVIYLARRLEGLRVALVLGVRSGEGSDQALLRVLQVEAAPVAIEPQPLSEVAVEALMETRIGPTGAEVVRVCHRLTGGNPFLLITLLDELRREGRDTARLDPESIGRFAPEQITTAVLLRVGRLGGPALELARAIAVLGEQARLAHAAGLAQLTSTEAAASADALARATILEAGRPLRFTHPIVRTAIYHDIGAGARSQMHRRAAAVLAGVGTDPETGAVHLLAVEPAGDPSVVHRLRDAATAARSRGAAETASRYLRRALREPPLDEDRATLTVELGDDAWHAHEPDTVELMREGFESARDPVVRARAALSLGPGLMFVGQVEEGVDVLERALDGLEDESLRSALEAMLLAAGISDLAAYRRVRTRLREARSQAGDAAGSAHPTTLACLTTEVALTGGSAEAIAEMAERALADDTLLRGAMVLTPFPYPPAFWLSLVDRPQAAKTAMDTALVEARARGSLLATAFPLAYRALAWYRLGAFPEAEADAQAAIDVGPGIPHATGIAIVIGILLERGDLAEARALLSATESAVPDPDMFPLLLLCEARARLASAQGEPSVALAELEACRGWEDEAGAPTVVPVAWRSHAALAHLALGDEDEARRLASEEVEIARRCGAARPIGVALRTAGLTEGGERGLELLAEAVRALEHSEDRLERARALVDLGAALRRAGQRTQARKRLADGMDLAHRCGAVALVSRAHDELRVAGARPRRLVQTGLGSLTASERRVAQMAADGLTNPAIAQALFVTLRTVEMHLSNVYRKLQIESRTQLPAALAGPGEH